MAKTYTGLRARIYGCLWGTFCITVAVGIYAFAGVFAPNVPFPDLGLGATPVDPAPLPILLMIVAVVVVVGGLGVLTLAGALRDPDYEFSTADLSGTDSLGLR